MIPAKSAASMAARHVARRQHPRAVSMLLPRSTLPVIRSFSTASVKKTQDEDLVPSEKRLTEDTMSENVRDMEYAVRGEVVAAADDLAQQLADNPEAFPNFDEILYTNAGNPHSAGQKSITWPREVMALCNLPDAIPRFTRSLTRM